MAVAALGGTSAAAVAVAAAAAAASSPFLCGGSFLLNSLLGGGSGADLAAKSAAALRAPPVYPDAAASFSSGLLHAAGISQPAPSTASSAAEDETRVSVDSDSQNHGCFLEPLSSLLSFPANPLAHQLLGRLAGPGRQ